ncbi:MAG: MATE family efflux transporter [Lachnospiraceae bacterium]
METAKTETPLGYAPIGKILPKFAIPAVISMLVSALYNIVDQIFIGQGIGMYGNAATNVAFPLTTLATALGLLLGIGGASNFNLEMGKKNPDKAKKVAGAAYGSLILSGIIICIIVRAFLHPLIIVFGATEQVLDYAMTYVGITSFGMPFYILGIGGNHLIRSDGSPTFAMISNVSGAVLNAILDPIFIFKFHWGIAGAAIATITGQILSAILVLGYLPRYKTVKFELNDFIPKGKYVLAVASLGGAACFNQLAMMLMQIVMNNILRYYGARSIYGSDIPLAVVGIVSKVNMLFMAIVIGISQGSQPLFGFNYGARNYTRVKNTYKLSGSIATGIAVIAFLAFQLFPKQITSVFGNGNEAYYQFAIRYFRVFMFFTFLNGIQPLTANFFTSIGKAKKGILLSMTRQIIFLIPLVVILPMIMGINGVMFAGPIADGAAGILAIMMVLKEFKKMPEDGEEADNLKN